MKKWLALLTVILTAAAAVAQSIPASQSRVAGRFVAYNYGLWNTYPASISPATGLQTFTVLNSYVNLGDGRLISPYATNAALRIGTETVTPSAVSTCYVNDVRIGVCQITATFTLSHTNSDKISSATFGLQEALNDAGNSGGGVVTVDSAWAGVGGTTAMVSGATIPANTSIEDVRTGGSTASGTVSGQTNGVIPLGTAPTAIAAQSHLDDGVTKAGSITTSESLQMPTAIPSAAPIIDPRHSSFAGGAVCDGVSDIGPAVQAAFNSIKTVGGQIQLVGNPLPCYWADPSQMDWSGRLAAVTIKITGQLKVGTTFSLGNGITLLGQAGGTGVGVATGPLAKITGPFTTGTLGTNVVAGQAQVFTPSSMTGITTSPVITCAIASASRDSSGFVTVTPSGSCPIPINSVPTITGSSDPSFNNIGFYTTTTGATITFLQGSPVTVATSTGGTLTATVVKQATAITVVGTTTCTTTGTVARVSNHVTATLTGPCHIPSGLQATIAGVTDSSFNGAFQVTDEDYILNTLTWYQVAADASSSGGTVNGVNEDSIETTMISSTNGATATAYFQNAHSSTDTFGIVTVMLSQGYNVVEDMAALGSGVNWWMYRTSNNHFRNISGGNQPFITNYGMEFNESWQTECTRCTISRAQSPKGSWGVRLTNQAFTGAAVNATGDIVFHRGYIYGDFKLDNSGAALTIDDHTIIEGAYRGGIVLDSRNFFIATGNELHFEGGSLMQDIFTGFTPKCLVNSLYGGTPYAEGTIWIQNGNVACAVNNYYNGQVKATGLNGTPQYGYSSPRGVVGQYSDTRITEAELRGVGASFSPAVVPFATQPVIQNPASWPTSSCSVATVTGPDGTATAGELTTGAGVGNVQVYSYSVTPTVGDWIFYGTWVNTPNSAGFVTATSGNFGVAINIDNNANQAHFQIDGTNVGSSNYWTTSMLGDWWHPVVAVSQITGADGTAGVIRLQLSCKSNHAMQYWKPFLMYVPASANVSLKEAMRIRQQMLHGYVPAGASTGNLYSLDPVVLPGDPTTANQAADKNYVDNRTPTCAAGTLGLCSPDGSTITSTGGVLTAVGAFVPLVLDFTRTAAASGIGCTGAAPGPYTCTGFPTGAHICTVYVISGGGGGGSGALEASGTNAFGGGGGAGAAAQFMIVPCSYFGGGTSATVTVTVGAGGTSGTAQSTNSTSGNAGGAGGASLISGASNSYASISTTAANAGAGGTTTTGTGGVAPSSVTFTGCVGAAGSSTTGGAAQCGAVNNGPGGGAGGGGVNTTPTAAAGGAQNGPSAQSLRSQNGINLTGGTLGGGNGQTPSWGGGTPASATTFFLSALGGTGGGGNAAGNGGTGGTGMFPGGGGAGGGAALNGSSSGAGGAGGDGLVRVLVQ